MKWEKAIYKTGKGGVLPMWEQYYRRWSSGEHIQAVAMNPPNGKEVKTSTVQGHIITALTFGMPVDLGLLVQQMESHPPNQEEWKQIEEAAAVRRVNPDDTDFKAKEVLCGVLGPENVNVDPSQKSEAQKSQEEKWYALVRWWVALRRVRFEPRFDSGEGDAKRQRTA